MTVVVLQSALKEVSEVFKAVKNACEGSRNEEQ